MSDLAQQLVDEAMAYANALLAGDNPEITFPDGMNDAFELGVFYGIAATVDVLLLHGRVVPT